MENCYYDQDTSYANNYKKLFTLSGNQCAFPGCTHTMIEGDVVVGVICGAFVIIDGADEVGVGVAANMLHEARIAVNTWPSTTVVITSRPLPIFSGVEESVEVRALSKDESTALIQRITGQEKSVPWGLPESIQEAISRPLFAILLSTYLKERNDAPPRSTGELISSLVERSLGRVNANRVSANQLLQRLASLCIDRAGMFIPINEVAARDQVEPLIESRLIIERAEFIGFPLPLLTEWFAAHCLAAGQPSPDDLVGNTERLERWRYPLIILVAMFNYEQVSHFLVPLAEQHPAFTSQIVDEGLASHGMADSVAMTTTEEAAYRIRTAMQSWVNGIDQLAQLTAPVAENNVLRPLGVHSDDRGLTVAWYFGQEQLGDVVQLPRGRSLVDHPEWPTIQWTRHGRQSAWIWKWTLESITHSLSDLLRRRRFSTKDGPLLVETIWHGSLVLTRRGSLWSKPMALEEIKTSLNAIPEGVTAIINGKRLRRHILKRLRQEIQLLQERGETELTPPWPGPDRSMQGSGWIWDLYSDEQLLARTKAVYTAALEGYQRLVAEWFLKLSPGLRTVVLLPARFVGIVVPPQQEHDGVVLP